MTRLRKFGIAGLVILVGIIFCASRIPQKPAPEPASPWRIITSPEEAFAQPLHAPVLLDDAIIWRPLGEDSLIYTTLDGSREMEYDWLIGTPLQWTAHAAGAVRHLSWRTVEGQLYNAVLSPEGEQLTAPVQVTERTADFETLSLAGGNLLVVWRQDSALWARLVDSEGRPLAPAQIQAPVEDFALGDGPSLAWVSGGELFAAPLEVSGAVPTLGTSQQIAAFEVPEEAWLSSLFFARVRISRLLIWGFGQADQPDVETYQGAFVSGGEWTFSLDLPARWASPSAAGDQLVLAVLVEDEWRQAILDLRNNALEILRELPPATGGLPAMRGETIAWVSLDEQAAPSLTIRTQNPAWGTPIATNSVASSENWRDALREGLEASPWGLIWLAAPLLSLEWLRGQERWYEMSLALALYWVGKAGLSFDLFSGYPSLFNEWEIASPFGFGVLVLVLINLTAALIGYTGWGDTPVRVRYAAYFLTDALLTFLIFWSHVE
jgi:hypothetical protein